MPPRLDDGGSWLRLFVAIEYPQSNGEQRPSGVQPSVVSDRKRPVCCYSFAYDGPPEPLRSVRLISRLAHILFFDPRKRLDYGCVDNCSASVHIPYIRDVVVHPVRRRRRLSGWDATCTYIELAGCMHCMSCCYEWQERSAMVFAMHCRGSDNEATTRERVPRGKKDRDG
jgi:hypothetical protein